MAWRRGHVERLNDWHHNYANVHYCLARSGLVRLGMQTDGYSEQEEYKHTGRECCQLRSLLRIPDSARHGTLVGCNRSATNGCKW